jgi:hypothetical protein
LESWIPCISVIFSSRVIRATIAFALDTGSPEAASEAGAARPETATRAVRAVRVRRQITAVPLLGVIP